jgi:RNA polymerase sigma factor (sigma-70 family)
MEEGCWMSGRLEVGSTDHELLRIIRNMNEQFAWEKFLSRYRPMIRQCCTSRNLNENEVDEIESQVTYRLLTFFTRTDNQVVSSFRGMLESVVHNEINTYLKKKIKTRQNEQNQFDLKDFEYPIVDQELLTKVQQDFENRLIHLNRVISKLKQRVEPLTWQIYWDYSILDLPAAEVAEKYQVSQATVYKYQKRVSEKMMEIVKALGFETTVETSDERSPT